MNTPNRFRFRAWHSGANIMLLEYSIGDVLRWHQEGQPVTIMQSTGLCDSAGTELFDDDVVYLAGYGDYRCVYPYTELFEAAAENDVGLLKGNVHDNPELLEDIQ